MGYRIANADNVWGVCNWFWLPFTACFSIVSFLDWSLLVLSNPCLFENLKGSNNLFTDDFNICTHACCVGHIWKVQFPCKQFQEYFKLCNKKNAPRKMWIGHFIRDIFRESFLKGHSSWDILPRTIVLSRMSLLTTIVPYTTRNMLKSGGACSEYVLSSMATIVGHWVLVP